MKKTAGNQAARKARVEHAIRETLIALVRDEVRDPRVRAATLLTVTKVEMNVDFSVANVYVSVVGDDATADGVLEGLKKAAGFLRGPVGREVGMQHAPELRFFIDGGIDMSEKLAAIIREDEERARAAGREVVPSASTPPVKPAPPPEPDDPDERLESHSPNSPPDSQDSSSNPPQGLKGRDAPGSDQ